MNVISRVPTKNQPTNKPQTQSKGGIQQNLMNHLYKYRQDLGKVARDGGILPSYQHQEAIIIIRPKGQLRGYQNPKRSVTGAGWQRGPLKRS